MNIIYSIDKEELPKAVELGVDSRTKTVKIFASVDKLLSRHLAVLGSTGYGKSNFNALLTRKVSEKYPNSRIVIFDINGEYAQAFTGIPNVKHTILGESPNVDSLEKNQQKGELYSEEYYCYKRYHIRH